MVYDLRTRHTRWIYEHLDAKTVGRVGEFRGVVGCSLDTSIWRPIRGHARVQVRTKERMLWPQHMLRVWAATWGRDRRAVSAVPVMTCLLRAADGETYTPAGVEAELSGYDLTWPLAERYLTTMYGIARGVRATDAIKHILGVVLGLPASRWHVTDSSYVLPVHRTWRPKSGESTIGQTGQKIDGPLTWLRVINDLCEALGYYAIHADARGVLQCIPYVAPGGRATTATLTEAEDGVRILPRVKVTSEQWDPVNRWIAWSAAEGINVPLMVSAINDDPQHPYSTVNLGYVRDAEPLRDVPAIGARLQARVDQAKAEGMADQRTFSVEARFHPLADHDVVAIQSETAALRGVRAAIAQREIECQTGEPMRLLLREVL